MAAANDAATPVAGKSLVGDYMVSLVLVALCLWLAVWVLTDGSWPARLIPSHAVRICLMTAVAVWLGMQISRRHGALAIWANRDTRLTGLEEYQANGVGPLPGDASAHTLYLDVMKRAVMNLIYEDRPKNFYDDRLEPVIADRFRLERRVMGEDVPQVAHTMVGLHRLNNLQECVERVLQEQVPGDLLEAGVLRGGASIFLRAVLKGHQCTDRKVIACDTFRPSIAPKPTLVVDFFLSLLGLLAAIPRAVWHKRLFNALQRINPQKHSFPVTERPSPELIKLTMFLLRNARQFISVGKDQTSLAAVKSHFAAYGLLDDQVMFLEGFFSDTLPKASLNQLALIRLDGDLYESTIDVLEPLYPKLSPGGFCIIDDYDSFSDCRKAVDEYRAKHNITAEMHRIDRLAVYWRKPM